MASRVIIIDPWWNDSMEQQAFGRVFRFGQTKESAVMRLAAENTVETEMIKMQLRKKKTIDMVIDRKDEKQ